MMSYTTYATWYLRMQRFMTSTIATSPVTTPCPSNHLCSPASSGGERRSRISRGLITVRLQEVIMPPPKKVKLLPMGPGRLKRAKSKTEKSYKLAVFLTTFKGPVRQWRFTIHGPSLDAGPTSIDSKIPIQSAMMKSPHKLYKVYLSFWQWICHPQAPWRRQ